MENNLIIADKRIPQDDLGDYLQLCKDLDLKVKLDSDSHKHKIDENIETIPCIFGGPTLGYIFFLKEAGMSLESIADFHRNETEKFIAGIKTTNFLKEKLAEIDSDEVIMIETVGKGDIPSFYFIDRLNTDKELREAFIDSINDVAGSTNKKILLFSSGYLGKDLGEKLDVHGFILPSYVKVNGDSLINFSEQYSWVKDSGKELYIITNWPLLLGKDNVSKLENTWVECNCFPLLFGSKTPYQHGEDIGKSGFGMFLNVWEETPKKSIEDVIRGFEYGKNSG